MLVSGINCAVPQGMSQKKRYLLQVRIQIGFEEKNVQTKELQTKMWSHSFFDFIAV